MVTYTYYGTVGQTTTTTENRYVNGIGRIMAFLGTTEVYYLYNAHGDVTGLTDSSCDLTKSYVYDAFGVETNPDAADANPFRYCGEYFDKETETYYLRARHYKPSTGRFTQQDGWGYIDMADPLSLNLYIYCNNNPILFVDPWGNDCWIFYDPYIWGIDIFTNEVINVLIENLEDLYGGNVFLIPIDSLDTLQAEWNDLMLADDIDVLAILCHADFNILQFQSMNEKGDLTQTFIGADNILSLPELHSTIGTVLLLGCNAGQTSEDGKNIASAFALRNDVGRVLASDGDLMHIPVSSAYILFSKNRVINQTDGKKMIEEVDGFKLYMRINGELDITVLGGRSTTLMLLFRKADEVTREILRLRGSGINTLFIN